MTKKVFKILSIVTLVALLATCIATMVCYYKYIGIVNKISNSSLSLMDKFALQESKDTALLNTFRSLLWLMYVTLVTVIINITNFILQMDRTNKLKVR